MGDEDEDDEDDEDTMYVWVESLVGRCTPGIGYCSFRAWHANFNEEGADTLELRMYEFFGRRDVFSSGRVKRCGG